jgi:hypothetical protein
VTPGALAKCDPRPASVGESVFGWVNRRVNFVARRQPRRGTRETPVSSHQPYGF